MSVGYTKHNKTLVFALFFGLTILASIAIYQRWFIRADYVVFDQLAQQVAKQSHSDENIVVIAIDDHSLKQMDEFAGRWVWPRSVHAELLERLQTVMPSKIAFDILFAEKDIYRPDGDNYLNEVVSQYDNVYFSMLKLNDNSLDNQLPITATTALDLKQLTPSQQAKLLLPNAINQENWRLGTINYHAELDGVARYYRLYQQLEQWRLPSLAVALAQAQYDDSLAKQALFINWRGVALQPYRTYSYVDVYRAVLNNDSVFLEQFRAKTILIGATAAGLYDARTTPINHNLPGVYLLATVIDNLLHNDFYQQASDYLLLMITVVILVALMLSYLLLHSYAWQLVVSIALTILTAISLYYFSYQLMLNNTVIFIASPLLIMIIGVFTYGLVFGYLEFIHRQKALSLFGRFLDPKIVVKLLGQGKLVPEHLNQKTSITILFSDIRGFTDLSEQHQAHEVLALLNHYFSKQVAVIFATRGTLDKFIGDCLMAFWGAPEASDQQAVDAIDAALLMQDNLQTFKQTLPEHLQHFDIGIGIHSGEAIAGLIGTHQRVDYTVIGDAVNLASRIEGLTKQSSRILVSEQTMLLAQDAYHFDYMGEFNVKGRQAAVKLYQPTRR